MIRLLCSIVVSTSVSGIFVACSEGEAPQRLQQDEPQREAPADECVEDAFNAAKLLGKTLKTRLIEAMGEGVEPAMRVCAEEAQAIHQRVAEQTGVRVGRASTKLRNPINAGPEWVAEYLQSHTEVGPPMKMRVDGMARAIIPLETAGLCVNCHGEPSEEVRAVLDARYPEDRATGYREGDLRGVIWAEKTCTR